jgi:hypothetical protein
VRATEKPPDTFVISRLKAGDILALGLTLIPKEGPGDLPGHMIMPEINLATYNDREKKPAIKEWCRSLAKLAAKDIPYLPDTPRLT